MLEMNTDSFDKENRQLSIIITEFNDPVFNNEEDIQTKEQQKNSLTATIHQEAYKETKKTLLKIKSVVHILLKFS